MRDLVKDGFKLGGHNGNFKPAKDTQRKVKADFEHMIDFKEVSKNRKGADGGVVTDPKNFLTSPPKKGTTYKGTLFGGKTEHMAEPFDRKKELEIAERKDHHQKMQDKPFSQKVKGKETFATIKEAYGEDKEYPARKPAPARDPLMTHDIPFKPSNPPKLGYNKTLDKFPAYIEDPLKFAQRKKEGEGEVGKWKPTHNTKTVVTPSVTTNFKNLKTEFPSIFRRL